jgi:hypothetical protein
MNSNTIKKNKFIPLIGINEECAGFCKNCCNSFKDSLAWCDHCISIKCKNNYSLFFNNNPKEPVKGVLVALENEQKQGVHYSKEELTQYASEDRNKTVESKLNSENNEGIDNTDEDVVKKLEFMYGIQGFKESNSIISTIDDTTKTLDNQLYSIEVPRIEVPRIEVPRNRSRSPRRNNSKINHRITQQHIIRVPTKELAKFAIEAALDRGIYNIRVFVN